MRCVQKNYGGNGREIKRIIFLLPYYKELADALAKNNMYAEMNSGCYRRCGCEIVMDVDMIKAMKKHDVEILTASYAHRQEDVGANFIMMGKTLR